MTGVVGSLLLDWCGWQSVFYFSGGLTLLWVCYVYRSLLSEKGNCGHAAVPAPLPHSRCPCTEKRGLPGRTRRCRLL